MYIIEAKRVSVVASSVPIRTDRRRKLRHINMFEKVVEQIGTRQKVGAWQRPVSLRTYFPPLEYLKGG